MHTHTIKKADDPQMQHFAAYQANALCTYTRNNNITAIFDTLADKIKFARLNDEYNERFHLRYTN